MSNSIFSSPGDDPFSPPVSASSKVKLHSDSFEETYHATSRLSRSSRKVKDSVSGWKQWDLEEPRGLRTYSRKPKKKRSNEVFEALVETQVRPSWVSSDEEEGGKTTPEGPPGFSPDDGPLFASPVAEHTRSQVHLSRQTPKQPIKRHKKCVSLSITSTPDNANASRSLSQKLSQRKCRKGGIIASSSPFPTKKDSSPKLSKEPVVLLQALTDSIIESYSKESVTCLCSSFDEDNVLECDYCPARIHAACHGISREEYDEILEIGLLWSCSTCRSKDKEDEGNESGVEPLKESDEEKNRVQAKGGKKWRRTVACHVAASLPVNGNLSAISTHEEIDMSIRLGEMSLLDQNENASMVSFDEDQSSPLVDILYCCQQNEILTFEDIYDVEVFEMSRKVGEGTFGEVYLLHGLDPESEYPPVLKVIPVDGSQTVNNEPQTTLSEVLTEIHISLSMSSLVERGLSANFVEIHMIHIVSGGYPEVLLRLWDEYDKEKQSLNTRPDYLGLEQKYIAFEFVNGGSDLETTELYNAAQGLSVFNQVAHALAVAEEQLSFEHRDLHWGNILIQGTEEETFSYQLDEDSSYSVFTSGVKATIIDFSLSRLSIHELNVDIFKDISQDETLFNAVGDYQFEIYRLMRKSNQNDWKSYTPFTNVLWLHYLLDKLISSVPYKAVKSRAHRSAMSSLRRFKKNMLGFLSAKHFVLSHGVSLGDPN